MMARQHARCRHSFYNHYRTSWWDIQHLSVCWDAATIAGEGVFQTKTLLTLSWQIKLLRATRNSLTSFCNSQNKPDIQKRTESAQPQEALCSQEHNREVEHVHSSWQKWPESYCYKCAAVISQCCRSFGARCIWLLVMSSFTESLLQVED